MTAEEIRKLPTTHPDIPAVHKPSEFECLTIVMRELAAQVAVLNTLIPDPSGRPKAVYYWEDKKP